MMKSKWTKYIVFGIVGLAIGGGVGYYLYTTRTNIDDLLKQAHELYDQGVKSYEAQAAKEASLKFDEARIQSQKAIVLISQKAQKNPTMPVEERNDLLRKQGEAMWVRARAIRDHAYAEALASGKPLGLDRDDWLGTKYRNIARISKVESIREAVASLNLAVNLLPDSLGPQREALRLAAQARRINWGQLEAYSKAILAIDSSKIEDPRDIARAHYYLAQFHLEQPKQQKNGTWIPQLPKDRKLDRIEQARDHLKELRKVKDVPKWRPLRVEAEIAYWLKSYYKTIRKPLDEQREGIRLEQLLFDPATGALAELKRVDHAELDLYSGRAIFGLYRLALGSKVKSSTTDEADKQSMWTIANDGLQFCKKIVEANPKGRDLAQEAAETGLAMLLLIQPKVMENPDAPIDWRASIELVDGLVEKHDAIKAVSLDVYTAFSNFLANEARIQANRDNKEWSEQLQNKAIAWLEAGLKYGTESKRPESDLLPLQILAAERAAIQTKDREEFNRHIEALKKLSSPKAQALVNFLEGVVAAREGRLGAASRSLQLCLRERESSHRLSATILLGHVYMALNQPLLALTPLEQARQGYRRLERLTPEEQAWATEFLQGEENVITTLIEANLKGARQRATEWLKLNPGQPIPMNKIAGFERQAIDLIKELPRKPPEHYIQAKKALAEHYRLTNRMEESRKILEQLKQEYPDRVDLVYQAIHLDLYEALRDAKVKKKKITQEQLDELFAQGDRALRRFRKEYPDNERAKLIWASWLIHTDRVEQAIAFLRDKKEFPDEKKARVQWTLAQALLRQGKKEQSRDLLQNLPESPASVAALMALAPTQEERKKWIQTGLNIADRKGIFLYWNGLTALNEQRPSDAVRHFFQAIQYSRMTSAAQVGAQRALFDLADKDANQARAEILKLLENREKEYVLYIGFAYTSFLLNEIGQPDDQWEKKKNMCSALNKGQTLLTQQTGNGAVGWVLKCRYWKMLNRPDLALHCVRQALAAQPKNTRALRLAAQLAASSSNAAVKKEAEEFLKRLEEEQANSLDVKAMRAQLLEDENRREEAIIAWNNLLKDHPKYNIGYLRLIRLLMLDGKPDQAEKLIALWRKEMPNDLRAVASEVRHFAATSRVEKAHEIGRSYLKKQIERARELWEKDWDARTDKTGMEEAIQKGIQELKVTVQTKIGESFNRARKWDDAEKWLAEITQVREPSVAALHQMGQIHFGRQEWNKAVEVYRKILAISKDNLDAQTNLAWILVNKLNNPDGAFQVIEEGRKHQAPGAHLAGYRYPPTYLETLGMVYVKLNRREHHSEMEQIFQEAIKRYPTDPRMYLYLGYAYRAQDNNTQAQRMFDSALTFAKRGEGKLTTAQRQALIQQAERAIRFE